MAKTDAITQEYLCSILDYDTETGIFRWRIKRSGRCVGEIAGSINGKGYSTLMINGVKFQAHRLAWLHANGCLPSQLDHINGVKTDNRLCNLRPATTSQNRMNVGRAKNNTTGFKGVTARCDKKRFQARIKINGKPTWLGTFNTAEEAHKAYCKAAKHLHGEFARFL